MRSRRSGLHRQLPAWSPLELRSLAAPLAQALRLARDPRPGLEQRLIERYDARGARLCASGTHALQLALEAVRASGRQGVVLLPAYTCYEVATAAVGARMEAALYDVATETLGPDLDSVRRAAHGRDVAAIVVAPLYGVSIDWTEARELARELGALLIEDAAQAHGSSFGDQAVGSFGDLSVLSFGRGKGWTGMGGGALLWRAEGCAAGEYAARAPLARSGFAADLRTNVNALAQWLLGRPALYGLPAAIPTLKLGETIYHDPTPLRAMGRASAALALATERPSDAEAVRRRAAVADYRTHLKIVKRAADPGAGALRAPLLRPGGWHALRQTEAASLGAGPPYPTTLAALARLQPLLVNRDAEHPGAARLVEELVTLPTHSRASAHERRRLASLLGSAERS